MQINTKFELGQEVWGVEVTLEKVRKPCPDCLGHKYWTAILPTDEEFKISCPTCTLGYEVLGYITEYEVHGHVRPLTIGSVTYDSCQPEETRYMCEETGLRSGTLWGEDRLFASHEEATRAMMERVAQRRVELDEDAARRVKVRGADRVGNMASHYRAQIREAQRQIKRAEEGLRREAGE